MIGFKILGALYIMAVEAAMGVNVVNHRDSTYWTQMEEGRWGGVEPRHLQQSDLLDDCISKSQIIEDIPAEFDARKKWIQCPSLYEIRDQGNCLSCYAVSIASVLTDRYCIASNGTEMFRFSDQDLLGCSYDETGWTSIRCTGKGHHRLCIPAKLKGCDGGSVERAWAYLLKNGSALVSGAPFKATDGCVSYEYAPCNHNGISCPPTRPSNGFLDRPTCPKKCQDSYRNSFTYDKVIVNSACQFNFPRDNVTAFQIFIQNVQLEIMKHGPIVAVMDLNEDWSSFDPKDENEIYETIRHEVIGLHAVKILGWGTSPCGKDYWLVANSFNYYWGNGGFFKIFRGMDRLISAGINTQMSTGLPLIRNSN